MSSIVEHYRDFLAERYTWMCGGFPAQVQKNRDLFCTLGLEDGANRIALDLGCGSGFQSLALAQSGYRVVSVDLSKLLLQELAAEAGELSIDMVHANMLDVEQYSKSGPFDVVVCMGDSLTHLESIAEVGQLIENAASVLRAGGRICLSFRDLTEELTGVDRALPVRLDRDHLMTTFLEYTPTHVHVHDIAFEAEGDGWQMRKSVYRKLRLSSDAAEKLLRNSGFEQISRSFKHGFTTLTAVR